MYILEQFNQTQSAIFNSQGSFNIFEIGINYMEKSSQRKMEKELQKALAIKKTEYTQEFLENK